VIGYVNLENLLENQEYLRASDAFMVSTGNLKSLNTPDARPAKEEIILTKEALAS
ncbi:MAG: hypothetical protein JWQ14_2182, partial [Adhaeribacter sp.]|nr:hypothetical protein [Adhaeribacter sp.]